MNHLPAAPARQPGTSSSAGTLGKKGGEGPGAGRWRSRALTRIRASAGGRTESGAMTCKRTQGRPGHASDQVSAWRGSAGEHMRMVEQGRVTGRHSTDDWAAPSRAKTAGEPSTACPRGVRGEWSGTEGGLLRPRLPWRHRPGDSSVPTVGRVGGFVIRGPMEDVSDRPDRPSLPMGSHGLGPAP
jgi:hypothetical protein